MLRLNIIQSGAIYDGHIDLDLIDSGESWNVNYFVHIRIGKKVWGKFVGGEKDFRGTTSIPKNFLTESWLEQTTNFDYAGAHLRRLQRDIWFFEKDQVSGQASLRFDGDPVEPFEVNCETPLGRITART